jgi:hypothetical protein
VATLRRVPDKELTERTRREKSKPEPKQQHRKSTPAEEAAARQRARQRSGEDD